jgi:quinolinate synthase
MNIVEKIKDLKLKKDAVILAHTYQEPEIQDIADYVGDSLGLSLEVSRLKNKVVVFCGVRFMAETAKIISPEKTILMPNMDATCPMAAMITKDELINFKSKYPGYKVVCYVNSTSETKAESDVCCTSSNAIKVVESLGESGVIFVPDQNLGGYVKRSLNKENMVLWPGFCSVHAMIKKDELISLKTKQPKAVVFSHPECKKNILDLSDYILSTSQMINMAGSVKEDEIIVVTETGVLHPLKTKYPNKKFYSLDAVCKNMKKTTIDMIIPCLENLENEVMVNEKVSKKAKQAVDNMLKIKI